MRWGLALFLAFALSCKSESEQPPPAAAPCTAIECTTSGVPPDACAEGFAGDGARGCTPILPSAECAGNNYAVPGLTECASAGVDACPAGLTLKPDGCAHSAPLDCENNTIAVLGSTKCQPIAPCGPERYPTTSSPAVYVDASYTGTDSDGSADRPFATLTDALARVDATKKSIALAMGVYEFASRIDVPVEIVGACQENVFIKAPKPATGPAIETFADVTLRSVDVSGPRVGLRVEKGTTRIFSSRVHDTGNEAIIVGSDGALELDRVVISRAVGAGVAVQSGVATIKNSDIRRTAMLSDGTGGAGVGATTQIKKASRVTIERSILARNEQYGVFAAGAELTVRDTLVTETNPPKGRDGTGILSVGGLVAPKATLTGVVVEATSGAAIAAFDGTIDIDQTTVRGTRVMEAGSAWALYFGVDPNTKKPVTAKVTRSVVSDTDDTGVFVKGAIVDIGSTIVRSMRSAPTEPSGNGLYTERAGSLVPLVNVHDSVIEEALDAGVMATAGTTTLERVAIRKIHEAADKRFGNGAIAFVDNVAQRPTLTVKRSLIEQVLEAGVIGFGARLEIDGTVIRGVGPRASVGFFGHGVHFSFDDAHQLASDGFVHGSFITDVLEVGVNVFMSNVEIDTTTISAVSAGSHGLYGDGVTVSSVNNEQHHPATVSVRRSKLSGVARAGLSVFEADAAVSGLLSTCNRIDITIETFVGKQQSKLSDEGDNECGCDTLAPCRAITANIEPIAR